MEEENLVKMISSQRQVKITRIINPSRFFFRDLTNADEEKAFIDEIEKKLEPVANSQKFRRGMVRKDYKKGDVSANKTLECSLN
jgi:hypothetical protein